MRILGEEPINAMDPEVVGKHVFEFDMDRQDWMLRARAIWDEVAATAYTFKIGKHRFVLPAGVYVYTGCVGGSTDWVLTDEIIGRPIETFVLDTDIHGWTLKRPILESLQEGVKFYLPSIRTPMVAVDTTGTKTIIVSHNDHFHRFKDEDFNVLFMG